MKQIEKNQSKKYINKFFNHKSNFILTYSITAINWEQQGDESYAYLSFYSIIATYLSLFIRSTHHIFNLLFIGFRKICKHEFSMDFSCNISLLRISRCRYSTFAIYSTKHVSVDNNPFYLISISILVGKNSLNHVLQKHLQPERNIILIL